jgi:hypothetical protein
VAALEVEAIQNKCLCDPQDPEPWATAVLPQGLVASEAGSAEASTAATEVDSAEAFVEASTTGEVAADSAAALAVEAGWAINPTDTALAQYLQTVPHLALEVLEVETAALAEVGLAVEMEVAAADMMIGTAAVVRTMIEVIEEVAVAVAAIVSPWAFEAPEKNVDAKVGMAAETVAEMVAETTTENGHTRATNTMTEANEGTKSAFYPLVWVKLGYHPPLSFLFSLYLEG